MLWNSDFSVAIRRILGRLRGKEWTKERVGGCTHGRKQCGVRRMLVVRNMDAFRAHARRVCREDRFGQIGRRVNMNIKRLSSE